MTTSTRTQWEQENEDEIGRQRLANANRHYAEVYQKKDAEGRGNCRRCDRQGFLNKNGYCSKPCENGQVGLPYQS